MENARSAVSKRSPDHTPRGLLRRPTSPAGIPMLAMGLGSPRGDAARHPHGIACASARFTNGQRSAV
ncbi:hypothetical protein T492DRAFT_1032592, partial [Pavlovales sp. CCMP2436]